MDKLNNEEFCLGLEGYFSLHLADVIAQESK